MRGMKSRGIRSSTFAKVDAALYATTMMPIRFGATSSGYRYVWSNPRSLGGVQSPNAIGNARSRYSCPRSDSRPDGRPAAADHS